MSDQPLSNCCRQTPAGVEIRVKVVPGASRSRLIGPLGDALKVQVAAPPEKGKANGAVIDLLAGALGCPSGAIAIVSGASNPRKTLLITGQSLDAVIIALARRDER